MGAWNGSLWLRIGTGTGALVNVNMNVGFHKMWGIS